MQGKPKHYSIKRERLNSFNISAVGALSLPLCQKRCPNNYIYIFFFFFSTDYLTAGFWDGTGVVVVSTGALPLQRNSPPSVPLLKGALRCCNSSRYIALKKLQSSRRSGPTGPFAEITGKIKVKA